MGLGVIAYLTCWGDHQVYRNGPAISLDCFEAKCYRVSTITDRKIRVVKWKSKQPKCDAQPVSLPGDANAEELAQLAWAIAHPARVQIVRLLINREACVCGEIVAELPLAQSTVSQHLKILKESGMIQGEIDGPKVCYCISKEKLEVLKTLIAAL